MVLKVLVCSHIVTPLVVLQKGQGERGEQHCSSN